jgi:CRISPR-associated protein Cas1
VSAADLEDELLPARMVNEVVYCPRLFWLEHVAGAFDDNAHTVLGQHSHRRVDTRGGEVHIADAGGVNVIERGTWLSSATLGVSAKLDRVISDAERPGCVLPVDTKKGKGPREGGLWPSDEVQLVLQALLLRDAGHRTERIAAYYESERRRVTVELDEKSIARAHAGIAEARRVRALTMSPPPLIDSPKCPGCSLVHICQPDEVHAVIDDIDASEQAPLRRVVPPEDDRRSLVVTSSTARIGIDREEIVVIDRETDEEGNEVKAESRLGLARIATLSIFGRAQLSMPALHALARAGAPVALFSSSGFFHGLVVAAHNNRVDVRMAQYDARGTERALEIARVLIADKIASSRTLLRRNRVETSDDDPGDVDDAKLLRLQRLVVEAGEAKDASHLLAKEGEAAKHHWAGFSSMLTRTDAAFAMDGRRRRPPPNPTNAMLSFLAGMLARDCTLAVALAGLDPFLGVFHTPHHGRPSLALDLMEPFRPLLVDSVVLGVVRRGEVVPRSFVRTGAAVSMDKDTRRALAAAYERRLSEEITHPRFGYRISYRQTLAVQARLLARALVGEIPALPSFRTR